MQNWKNKLDNTLRDHLNIQLRNSFEQEEAFKSAQNKANAQLWVAIANLSKDVFDLNLKVKYLERKLTERNQKKIKKIKNLRNLKKY